MKAWKLLVAVAVAVVAMLLMTSIVIAAPTSAGSVPTNRVYGHSDQVMTGTMPLTHPVAIRIALYFNLPYTQVMALHAEGFGFGTIARAYLTALASGGQLSPTQVLAMHLAGIGWGQIKKEYGVHPGGNGLGTIMREKPVAPQPELTTPAPPEVKQGNPASTCPGNSCNAPGHNKFGSGPGPNTPKSPKNK
jgi:hypothetical protein